MSEREREVETDPRRDRREPGVDPDIDRREPGLDPHLDRREPGVDPHLDRREPGVDPHLDRREPVGVLPDRPEPGSDLPDRHEPGIDPHLDVKIGLFFLAAVLGLAGIILGRTLPIFAAMVAIGAGLLLRFVRPRGGGAGDVSGSAGTDASGEAGGDKA